MNSQQCLEKKKKFSLLYAFGIAASIMASIASIATARDDAGSRQFFLQSAAPSAITHGTQSEGPTARRASAATPQRSRLAGKRGGIPRILTVRAGSSHVRVARALPPRLDVALGSISPVVSMYNDTTLRLGDAIMTTRGLRIFQGSDTFPFRPEDFSTLDRARGLTAMLRKSLADADQNPSGRVLARQARL